MGRHFFLGAHGLDPGHVPFRSLRLGVGPTNRDMVNELRKAIDMQVAVRERNEALPPEFRLDEPKNITPVDQLIDDQVSYFTEIEQDPDLWDQPADRKTRNIIMSTASLIKALEARLRDQETKAAAAGVKVEPPKPSSVAKAEGIPGGAIVAAIGIAAFAAAYLLSAESWSMWPWRKSAYQPVASPEGK